MAAATIKFTTIGTEEWRAIGNERRRVVRLTMVASSSTYTDGGLADTTNFPASWQRRLDFERVSRAVPLTKLRTSTFEDAFDFEVDLTNRKVILYGLPATPAEGEGDSELANSGSIPDGTYTADVELRGD